MIPGNDSLRYDLTLRMERVALLTRYIAYFIMAPLYFLQMLEGSHRNFIIVSLVLGFHAFYSHVILLTRKYHLFQTPLNFAIYLLEFSLVIFFTGADGSDMYILYIFLLIGYAAYARRYRQTLQAAVACSIAYGVVIICEWFKVGVDEELGIIVLHFLAIVLAGWVLGAFVDMFRRSDEQAQARARELAMSRATLRLIFDGAPNPILVYSGQEIITDANESACNFLNVSTEKIIGQRLRTFLFDDGTLPVKFADVAVRGEYRGEHVVLTSDGEEHDVELSIRPFLIGTIPFYVAMLHDITSHKETQEALRLASISQNKANEELRRANELRSSFVALLTQRLRSPLTASVGYVDLLLEEESGELSDDQRQTLHVCRRSLMRLFRLIDESFRQETYAPPQKPAIPANQEDISDEPDE